MRQIDEQIDTFDSEGGAMAPTSPYTTTPTVVESDKPSFVLAYALVALSGFAMGLLVTYIF